jgi:hypothetical protein
LLRAGAFEDKDQRPRGNEHSEGEAIQSKALHHGRQISEVGTETGIAKAVEKQRLESKEAGAHHVPAGHEGQSRGEQEEVRRPTIVQPSFLISESWVECVFSYLN